MYRCTTSEGLVLEGPRPRGQQFEVEITDPLTGESVFRPFRSRIQAEDWMVEQASKNPNVRPELVPTEQQRVEQRGDVPHMTRNDFWDNAQAPEIGAQSRPRAAGGESGASRRAKGKINIRSVREVLEEAGLDPTVELVAIIQATVPETDAKGNVIVDALTGETIEKHVLPQAMRASLTADLIQYVQPKLKAVEMKVEDKTPPTDEQLDARIKHLMRKPGAMGDGA